MVFVEMTVRMGILDYHQIFTNPYNSGLELDSENVLRDEGEFFKRD